MVWYIHTDFPVPEKESPIELFEGFCLLMVLIGKPMTLFARKMGDKFDSCANLGTFEEGEENYRCIIHQ
jgi:hypothetical protein